MRWDATAFAVLALANRRRGRAEEAAAALAKARAILAQKMPDPAKGQRFAVGGWHDWLHARILCHEAEQRLKKESGIRNPAPGKKPN